MKVEAYKCDYCKKIYEAEEIKGVQNITTMFEDSDSFPTAEASKTEAHFCMDCYRLLVDINVKNKMNWKEGEQYSEEREVLKRKLHKEFYFIFKKEIIRRNLADKPAKKRG
jgi:hypothetical protein